MELRRMSDDTLWPLRPSVPAARDELVRRHLPLARSLAARYRNANDAFEDLVQVASLGLIAAVDRFDPERGRSFAGFAVPTILGELRRYFRDTGWSAHVPRRAKELALEAERGADELTDLSGRVPTVPELAAHLGREIDDVIVGLEARQAHFASSLDAPAQHAPPDESGAMTLLERTGGEDESYALIEARESLKGAMARLPWAERRALRLRVNGGLTQSQVADELGCSQMKISRLLRSAARNVRGQLQPE